MAKGRMISKDITIDEEVRKLSDKGALLYTWMIPFLDRDGKFYAKPAIVKGRIMAFRDSFSLLSIAKLLKEIEKAGLIRVYGNEGEYLVMKGFSNNNKPHPHEPKSTIPNYKGKPMS